MAGMGTGSVLAGRYVLGEEVSHGGMGTVYRADDLRTGATVAVKVPHPHLGRDPSYRERLRREAELAAALTNPRIVRVVDLDEQDGTPFLVMEYVAGETLGDLIDRRGPLPPAEALGIALEVARALEAAHALGIVHRDLKPQNVMLVDGQVKVLDFGVARAEGMSGLTLAGDFVGTPAYSAPERAAGRGDIRADIYSLGVLLYVLLTGRAPFDARSPLSLGRQQLAPPPLPEHVPDPARRVVFRCLAPTPEDRHQTPTELVAAIVAAGEALGSAPVPSDATPRRRPVGDLRPGGAASGTTLPQQRDGASVRPAQNLPERLTSFVGREREMSAVVALLRRGRLVTLTGAGGAGKTRLALEVAALTVGDYLDGAFLVELAPLADPGLVPQAVATVIGVREGPGRSLTDAVVEHLRSRRLLLVLDNCEHLLDAWAAGLQTVLQSCPGVRVLATSRQALGIPGEVVWQVPPLTLPAPFGEGAAGPGGAAESEAVRLFVERARAARLGFALTAANAPAVVQICRRLDGLPLALELAAARVKVLSPEQIAARLDDRFRLLTGGRRTDLPHHQTLRATVDWSYDLLDPAERALFDRLAVFVGGFTLELAEAVCAGPLVPPEEVLDLLTRLVDRSLVLAETRDGEARYDLLETLRDYGLQRLAAGDDLAATRVRHAAAFLDLATRADGRLTGPDQAAVLRRLEAEHDNLRAALRHFLQREDAPAALRLAGALARFWDRRGHLTEGRALLDEALRLAARPAAARAPAEEAGPDELLPLRARALNGAANLAHAQGDFRRAVALQEEALALRRRLGDRPGLAASLYNLALAAGEQGDLDRAVALHQEALALRRDLGDERGTALSLASLGLAAQMQGDDQRAAALCREGLAIARALDDSRLIAYTLLTYGRSLQALGDPPGAGAALDESLDRFRQLGDSRWVAYSRAALGLLALAAGDLAAAGDHFRDGLIRLRDLDETWGIPLAIELCAALAGAAGDWARAARLFGAAAARRAALDVPLPPRWAANRDARIAAARAAAPSPVAFEDAWAAGAALPPEAAVDLALP